jgi:RimJ/RimL family protein N-acetyltransferase
MAPHTPTTPNSPLVTLRPHVAADVPILFGFEQDPAWGATSMTKSRDEATFRAAWARVLGEGLHQRAILADGVLCGSVGCLWSPTPTTRSPGVAGSSGRWMIGYGLGPAYWGKGIASKAVGLLLMEVEQRPLYATAAASNVASIRVLEKHGFVLLARRTAPETPRTLAREELEMVLGDGIRDS